ncbi:MAG: DoxX family protein [Phycisphaerales bacterium]|nr:DoxX family protein [Phycisphaerales bacterium]
MASQGSKTGPLVSPLLLRVVLGTTFIWAGLGKLIPIVDYKGQDAAILANLGTGVAPVLPQRPPVAEPPALAPPASLPLPEAAPTGKPAPQKPSSRQSKPATGTGYTSASAPLASLDRLPVTADTSSGRARPAAAKGKTQPVTTPAPPKPAPALDTLPPGGKYTAAHFAEPARARRAYQLSVVMVRAAYPQPSVGTAHPKPYWPAIFATSPWVVWLAFGVAVTELFAGVLLMVGFLTRLSAALLVCVALAAMWLTQIGPALSTGQTTFGLLPNRTWWDPQLWTAFFWQLLIIASGIAVACMGAGALSVDRALAVIGSGGPKSEPDPSAKG